MRGSGEVVFTALKAAVIRGVVGPEDWEPPRQEPRILPPSFTQGAG